MTVFENHKYNNTTSWQQDLGLTTQNWVSVLRFKELLRGHTRSTITLKGKEISVRMINSYKTGRKWLKTKKHWHKQTALALAPSLPHHDPSTSPPLSFFFTSFLLSPETLSSLLSSLSSMSRNFFFLGTQSRKNAVSSELTPCWQHATKQETTTRFVPSSSTSHPLNKSLKDTN